jgi:hypothetical protein
MNPSMTPVPIPPEAAASRPHLKAISVGPPPGVSDADCGTVESLAGIQDGYPMYADYWRPTPEQLEALAAGGFIELIQYAPRMVMHSMTVWDIGSEQADAELLASVSICVSRPGCPSDQHSDRCPEENR